jgi:hypothetical protein
MTTKWCIVENLRSASLPRFFIVLQDGSQAIAGYRPIVVGIQTRSDAERLKSNLRLGVA